MRNANCQVAILLREFQEEVRSFLINVYLYYFGIVCPLGGEALPWFYPWVLGNARRSYTCIYLAK